MHTVDFDGSFAGWREAARAQLKQGMAPHQLNWTEGASSEPDLFGLLAIPSQPSTAQAGLRIPRLLLEQLESAARFRCRNRWALLYRILWRVAQGDQAAMLAGDIDGSELHRRLKAVRREAHHLHAFLRFKPCQTAATGPELVAWHEPAHDILPSAAEHFSERLGRQSWLIATPDDGVYWDGHQLHYQRPCPQPWQRLAQETDDQHADLWLAYYGSTFNPSRLNRSVLQTNMPVRFWRNLPEGPLIPRLMTQARTGDQCDGQAQSVANKPGKRIRVEAQSVLPVR